MKKGIFGSAYFLSVLWGVFWLCKDIDLFKQWWGLPFVYTVTAVIVLGIVIIIKLLPDEKG